MFVYFLSLKQCLRPFRYCTPQSRWGGYINHFCTKISLPDPTQPLKYFNQIPNAKWRTRELFFVSLSNTVPQSSRLRFLPSITKVTKASFLGAVVIRLATIATWNSVLILVIVHLVEDPFEVQPMTTGQQFFVGYCL